MKRGIVGLILLVCLSAFPGAFLPATAGETAESALRLLGEQRREDGGDAEAVNAAVLRKLLARERNITVEEMGGMLVVDGRVSSLAAKERLDKIASRYGNILDLTEFLQDEDTMTIRAQYIQKKVEERLNTGYDPSKAFVPPQRVSYDILNNDIILMGDLNNEQDVASAGRMINIYARLDAANAKMESSESTGDSLGLRKVPVEIALIFARMTGSNEYDVGMSGLNTAVVTIPESTQPLRKWNISFGTDGKGYINLNDLVRSNMVLARPHLSTLNGTAARFHSGGQAGSAPTTTTSPASNGRITASSSASPRR